MIYWPYGFESGVAQTIIEGGDLYTSWHLENKKRNGGRDQLPNLPFEGRPMMTQFPATRSHLSKVLLPLISATGC